MKCPILRAFAGFVFALVISAFGFYAAGCAGFGEWKPEVRDEIAATTQAAAEIQSQVGGDTLAGEIAGIIVGIGGVLLAAERAFRKRQETSRRIAAENRLSELQQKGS